MGISSDELYNAINGSSDATIKAPPVKVTPITAQSLYDITNKPSEETEPEGQSWLKVGARAYTNLPESGYEFGKNLATGAYQTVRHPIETANGVLDLAAGALHNILPEHVAEWMDKADWDPESTKHAVQTANAVGHILKNKYGSSENFKETLATDPVGVASDVAALLTGGEGLAVKAGLPTVASKLGAAESVINPISGATKAVEAVGKPVLGMSTGTGVENISNAAKAGYTGDTSFWTHLTGNAPFDEPLNNAKANLNVMRQERGNAYRNGMVDISNDKSVLNFSDIDKALKDAKDSISFKGQGGAEVPTKVYNDLSGIIDNWKKLDPAEFHTPEGLDFLKKNIGDYNQTIDYKHSNANRLASDIYNSIKGTISNQAPTYSKVMSDYHEASDDIQEIEKALSLGNRASADTALRRLQSLTRNNVNTNYGQRLSLAQQLETEGGKPFINALSGQAMSSPTARGLAGSAENLTALGGIFHDPTYLAAIPFQTPKLVGGSLYIGGKLARKAQDFNQLKMLQDIRMLKNIPAPNLTAQKANTLSDLLQYQNQAQEQ